MYVKTLIQSMNLFCHMSLGWNLEVKKLKKKLISGLLCFSLMLSYSLPFDKKVKAEDTSNVDAKTLNIYSQKGTTAITIDMKTGEIIYAKNIDAKVFPASTTKLLTALVLNDSKKETDMLTYTKSAAVQPAFSLNVNIHAIKVGDKLSADDALKGLLIYSGNDAAYVIAANIINKLDASPQEVRDEFSVLMNKKAEALGLKNSHFITPNGLHDPNHYTTAYDMSLIGRKALENPWILKTIGLQETTLTTENGVKIPITNRNKIIFENEPVYDKTCLGGKTGYTEQAGKCLVAKYERNGRQIMGIVMNAPYDSNDVEVFKDMNEIINWSYSQKQTTLYKKEAAYKTVSLSYKPLMYFGPTRFIEVPLNLSEDLTYYSNSVNDAEKVVTSKIDTISPWKLSKDKSIGTVTLKERGITKTYKIYPGLDRKDILSSNKILYVCFITFSSLILLLIVLIAANLILTAKKKRPQKKYY